MEPHRFLLPALLLVGLASGSASPSVIRLYGDRNRKFLRDSDTLYCESWKFAIETNDAGEWYSIPSGCLDFVKDYMTGDRYLSDSTAVAQYSLEFAKTVEIAADGMDSWVFDVDETLLSNLAYYEAHGFGKAKFNETAFEIWEDMAKDPALPASLTLYKEIQQLGFKIFLLTGRSEAQRNATETNLRQAGYSSWERLILRNASDEGKPAIVYKPQKRLELQNEGYRLLGSSGDQWSDLLGPAQANRSFKLPNPMYYVP